MKRHSPAFIVPKGVFSEAGSPWNRNALLVSFFSSRAFCLGTLPMARKLRPTFKLRYVRSIDFIVLRQKTLASMACGQIARWDGILLVFFLGIVGGKIRAGVKSSDRLGRPIWWSCYFRWSRLVPIKMNRKMISCSSLLGCVGWPRQLYLKLTCLGRRFDGASVSFLALLFCAPELRSIWRPCKLTLTKKWLRKICCFIFMRFHYTQEFS